MQTQLRGASPCSNGAILPLELHMHVSDFLYDAFFVSPLLTRCCMHACTLTYLIFGYTLRGGVLLYSSLTTYDQYKLDVPAYIPYMGNVGQAGKNRPITAHGFRKAKHYYYIRDSPKQLQTVKCFACEYAKALPLPSSSGAVDSQQKINI